MRRRRTQIRDHHIETRLFRSRAFISFLGIIVMIALLLGNLYNIQVNQYQDYKTRSNDNRIKVVPIAPNRGLIYDRNGRLLAENRPVFNLSLFQKIDNIDETIVNLQEIMDIPADKVARFHKEEGEFVDLNLSPFSLS